MNILEFIEKEKKPSITVLKILELMENLPIPDDDSEEHDYWNWIKLKRFNNECYIIQVDHSTAQMFTCIYELDLDVLNCELQKRYGIRLVSMITNPHGAELNFKIVPQTSFQSQQRTGYYLPTSKPCSLDGLKFSESFMEKFKNKDINDPEVLKEFKNYFHEIFMDNFKRKIGGTISDTAVAEAEKSFEGLFKTLVRVLKETEEPETTKETPEEAERKKKLEEELKRRARGIEQDEAARHTVRFPWEN